MVLEKVSNGVYVAKRTVDEPAFSMLKAPSVTGGKKWHLHPKDGAGFTDEPCSYHKTKADAVYELEHAAKHCSAYQLGLVDEYVSECA